MVTTRTRKRSEVPSLVASPIVRNTPFTPIDVNVPYEDDVAAAAAVKTKKRLRKDDDDDAASSDNIDKFKHLLQPIKNLAENWSIDLAHELEEYLDEVEGLSFQVPALRNEEEEEDVVDEDEAGEGEGERTKSFSFAKAALLLQGAGHVYGKKVEYLHTLVLDAIDKVLSKSKRKALMMERRKNCEGGGGGDFVEREEEDEWEWEEDAYKKFLELDDLEEKININMEEQEPEEAAAAEAAAAEAAMKTFLLQGEGEEAEARFLGSMMMLEEATPEAVEEATTMAAEFEEEVVDAEEEATPAAAPEPFFEAFEAEEEAEEEDPYAPLDPFNVGSLKERPFRRGTLRARMLEAEEEAEADLFEIPRCGFAEFRAARQPRKRQQQQQEEAAAEDWAFDEGDAFDAFEELEGEANVVREEDVESERGEPKEGGRCVEDVSYEERVGEWTKLLVPAVTLMQTDLAKRVSEWKKKIEPALAESQKHASFDIEERGEDIVRMNMQNKNINFLKNEQRFEICRSFAAMLQLVNDGKLNVPSNL